MFLKSILYFKFLVKRLGFSVLLFSALLTSADAIFPSYFIVFLLFDYFSIINIVYYVLHVNSLVLLLKLDI